MTAVQHVFGEQVDGQTYHARRAVYAVILDSDGRVATARHNFSMQILSGQLRILVTKETCHMHTHDPRDYLPDIRDGLTHRERIVLQCLYDLQQERGGRNVPTGMLYGTVVEHVDMSVEEMQSILIRLVGYA